MSLDIAGLPSGEPAKPRVLCVDDEPYVLEGLRDVLRRSFDVHACGDPLDALQALRSDPAGYAVVISDMQMPRMSGADFLREARFVAPNAVLMLLTGHADLHAAIKAVNGARLFRFLLKPCDSGELMRACATALGQHRLQVAEKLLLEQTLRGSLDALAEVLSLTNPAAFGRARRLKILSSRLATAVALPNAWEVEVAAMLAPLGAVTLPQATAEKLYANAELTPAEQEMVERMPEITQRLVARIPRLEGVLEILASYRDAAPGGAQPPPGALVLRIAADYDDLEGEGADSALALGVMRSRGVYDRQLLYAFADVIGLPAGAPSVREISLTQLSADMMLADDVRSVTGGLLVARGQQVTDALLDRLANLTAGLIRQPLRVTDRPTPNT